MFKELLENDWRYEISTIAAADLGTKKWNKVTILPLARDLKVFRSYLLSEAFQDTITPTEIILLTKVKQVVSVLCTNDLQQHTAILIKLRSNFFDDNRNIYLFPNLNAHNPITGYKILQKLAKMSGGENPGALTST